MFKVVATRGSIQRALRLVILTLVVATSAISCATYQGKVDEARRLLGSDNPSQAAARLEPLALKDDKDQLVYMLDYAVALQQSGRFQESAKAFAKAEKIADIQDYHSLTNITGSLLLSEEMVQYKGDDYEKVLINAVNSVNYLMLDELDSALVEIRRLNEKLYKFKYEAKRDYEQNPYAFYLSGVIWEADKKWDDAYIDYKKAYELVPDYAPLREDLIRAAIRAQRPEDLAKWKKMFPEVKPRPEWRDPSIGELVFVFQQGWGPRKYPHPQSQRVPKLYPTLSYTQRAQLEIEQLEPIPTQPIYSVEQVAIKTMDDQYAPLIAKRVAGVVAKAVVADQVRQKNALLGEVAWLAMNLSDRADLRQWSTLPQSFQIARAYLKPGTYNIKIRGLNLGGGYTGEESQSMQVEIKPSKKTFITWRSFR